MKALASAIGTLFRKRLPENEIQALIEKLQPRAVLKVDGARLTYALPA